MYAKILDSLEGTAELDAELALFNKLGDLYLKAKQVQKGVETYERAAELYEKAGFPNNAIALCNKILRNAPGRTEIYLKLAKLMLQRGFAAEAKQNLLEYAQRMQHAGQLEQAFRALKEFAELSPDNEEIRLLLAEQLKAAARTDEAREQLARLYAEVEAEGDQRRARATLSKMKAIDPDFDPESAPKAKVQQKKKKSGDLVFLDLDETPEAEEEQAPAAPAAVEEPPLQPEPLEIETTSLAEGEAEVPPEEIPQEETQEFELERASADYLAIQDEIQLEGLETDGTFEPPEEEVEETPSLDIETTVLDDTFLPTAAEEAEEAGEPEEAKRATAGLPLVGEGEEETTPVGADADGSGVEVPDLDLTGFGDEEEAGAAALEVPTLDLGEEPEAVVEPAAPAAAAPAPPTPPAPPTLDELEARVADNPDDPAAHQALGEALIEQGDRERGLLELDHALNAAEAKNDWGMAEAMADEILRLDSTSVRHHQKRVEYAYRRNDRNRLVRAYLALADSLFREGAVERARAVYQRVLEHDPENESAKTALSTLEPEEEAAEAPVGVPSSSGEEARGGDGDFVDLGALVLGEDAPARKDTRMRIQEEEPTGDEERDFAEMLATFKKGIEQNVEEEDWEAHYDLGVAFKEMGLLDEAIAAFQKALRSAEGRLKSAEALGMCFFEKGQYSVASTVLRRAVDADPRGDEEKVGLLYWVGRAEEEQGRAQHALDYYQRVFAIDINFQDVSDRVKILANAER